MTERLAAVLVGPDVEVVRALLRDGLEAIGVDLVEPGRESPDVVLALIDRVEPADVVAEAVRVAAGAPVVAVLPFADDVYVNQALAAGARSWYSLVRSLDELRQAILDLLAHAGPEEPVADRYTLARDRHP